MRRIIACMLAVAFVGLGVAEMTLAQQQPPAPRAEPQPPVARDLEGTVKKVDPAENTVQVSSGVLGIFRTTLMVTGDTRIQVEGRDAALGEIQEGAQVKASYEVQDGKSIAKSIDVSGAPAASAPAPGSAPSPAPRR
jgi:Cu/Ag efflux protein CusF